MADRRRRSRFRLPWLQATPAPPRPQRPPPAPPSPQAQTPSKSQQPSPPPTESTRSQVTPQPVSPPPRASAQSQGAPEGTSTTRMATGSRSAAQPPSPSRSSPQPEAETEQASQAAPQPQSPPPKLATQPLAQASSLPPSSPSLTTRVTQPPLPITFPPSTEPILSVSEEEPKPARSVESQELQPKAETASENVSSDRNQTQSQMTFRPNEMPTEHSEASVHVTEPQKTSTAAEETPVLTQKPDASIVSSETKSLPESDGNQGEDIEGREILQEDGSKEKITAGRRKQRAEATQMHPTVAFDAEQKQQDKDEFAGRKETTSNSSSHGKEDQTVILNLKDKATVSESHHEPNIANKENGPQQREIRENTSKFLHGMATHQQKLPLGEIPAIVVTLAGENRGASMQLGSQPAKREGTVHIRRGYKINPDESSTDGEMSFKGKGSQDSKAGDDQESKAYINSNVQGVNNSIMLNSAINEWDAGVQLALTRDRTQSFKPNTSMEFPDTRKAQVNVTTAQKLTYEPTVRRRCLRGLFSEPSDSDPDNPEKPRRHGCRVACKGKSQDNEIDVV